MGCVVTFSRLVTFVNIFLNFNYPIWPFPDYKLLVIAQVILDCFGVAIAKSWDEYGG